MHRTFLLRKRSFPAFLYPLLYLAEAIVIADRKGIGAGNLHSVVLLRVMGCGNLDGSVETVLRGSEIHHRGSAEANVVNIGARIGDALQKIFVNLIRGHAAVPAHEDLVRSEK